MRPDPVWPALDLQLEEAQLDPDLVDRRLHVAVCDGALLGDDRDRGDLDEEVVREVADFERIKCTEMKDTLGGLAGANVKFYKGMVETWEKMLQQLDEQPA